MHKFDAQKVAKIKEAATKAVASCAEKHKHAEDCGEECYAMAWVEFPAPLLKSCLDAIKQDPASEALKETIRTFRRSCTRHPEQTFTVLADQALAVIQEAEGKHASVVQG